MGPESSTSLAPGFRFHPTDVELVGYYLRRKVSGKAFRVDAISDVDVYKSEPWDLPGKSRLKTRDLEWYFFSALDKKHNNGSKTNRATEKGYWKTTGKDRAVPRGGRIVGMKKTLVYHKGRAPRGERTNWVMHEYKLVEEELKKIGVTQDAFVVCRIFQKSGPGAKNGEQYGAPLADEEWDDEEDLVLVPDQAAEAVAPAAQLAPAEDSYAGASDLDEELKDVLNAPLPLEFNCGNSSNNTENLVEIAGNPLIGSDGNQLGLEVHEDEKFYCDDSGNNAENYNHFVQDDESTLIGTDGNHLGLQGQDGQKLFYFPAVYDTSESVKNEYYVDLEQFNGDDFILEDPYMDASDNHLEIDVESGKDDYFVEQSSISNPVDASYFPNETYLDAFENPPSFDDGFDKTDFLINTVVEGGNSGIDMMEEYLKYLDSEGGSTTQFMPFDPSNVVGAENPISDQAFQIQKEDVHVQSQQGLMESHQLLETENRDAASSSKQNQEAEEHDTDIPYSFIKQASCKQAFASEISPQNALLRMHSGAQSSSPIHITAGMIRIQDVTERGGLRMNWSYGKDGNLNLVFSFVLPQCDSNTANMDPVASFLRSVKMASTTSWAWFYNICFCALVLCVGYKVGTSIYTR